MKHCTYPLVLCIYLGSILSISAQVRNIDFSSGNLSGWSSSAFGDITPSLINTSLPYSVKPAFSTFLAAQTVGNMGTDSNEVVTSQVSNFDGNGPTVLDTPISPFAGTQMAFITNSASDTIANGNGIVGSSLYQEFFVPLDALTLSFDSRYLSNEGLDNVLDTNNQIAGADFAGIALTSGGVALEEVRFDAQSGSSANYHLANFSPDGAIGFGGFISGTDWIHTMFDLTPYRGQNITLTNYIVNTGDTLFESRLLLNGFLLSTASPTGNSVPEPGSIALVSALVVFGIGSRIHRRCKKGTARE